MTRDKLIIQPDFVLEKLSAVYNSAAQRLYQQVTLNTFGWIYDSNFNAF